MSEFQDVANKLRAIAELQVKQEEPLARHTRFGIGGPADLLCDAAGQSSFTEALATVIDSGAPYMVIGGGSNLIVSDEGYRGVVLRFSGESITQDGCALKAEAGAALQSVVDSSIGRRLAGMESMTGIPGHLGGAVYGNAGAYGRAMNELVERVTFTDGHETRTFTNAECEFQYRESIFKRRKDWIVLDATMRLAEGDGPALRAKADEIRAIRDAKYPPDMKCAGSIFKNVFFRDLPGPVQHMVPEKLVRDGKLPSAWFLEQAGVKGYRRGDIKVAEYHANLIYNEGAGKASDLLEVIEECKRRVRDHFGFDLQEEVQYVGFEPVAA